MTRPRTRRHRDVPQPYRATPEQAAHAVSVAVFIRPRVSWTQAEGLRRLAFALRPWIATGRCAADLVAELSVWRVSRRPASPAAVIMARRRELADLVPPAPDMHPGQECSQSAFRPTGSSWTP
ncbi:hypothetical protein [Streptomyces sp. NPDC059949]|uniref:hypothetical protein n=1 Tax=Streptomyces sp. NPDC059949 TaxID=3347013 RepID=UPI003648C3CC